MAHIQDNKLIIEVLKVGKPGNVQPLPTSPDVDCFGRPNAQGDIQAFDSMQEVIDLADADAAADADADAFASI